MQHKLLVLLCVQTWNTQVEAALQSGLNFKNRFTTNSRKRLQIAAASEEPGDAVVDGEQLNSSYKSLQQYMGSTLGHQV